MPDAAGCMAPLFLGWRPLYRVANGAGVALVVADRTLYLRFHYSRTSGWWCSLPPRAERRSTAASGDHNPSVRMACPTMRVHPTTHIPGPRRPQRRRALTTKFLSPALIEYVHEDVLLSPLARFTLWATVLLLTLLNTLVLVVFALVYAQNEEVDSLLWVLRNFFLYSDANVFLLQYSRLISRGYAVLSVVSACIAARMITPKRFRIGARLERCVRTLAGLGLRWTPAPGAHSSVPCWTRLKQSIARARQAISVRGPYFELRVLVEEWFELATQTTAAYSASHSISSVPLNLTYATVIFANSISSMVYTRTFPHHLVKQRLACVFTDLVLDFVWGTLLPIWMYVPIVEEFVNQSILPSDIAGFSGFTRVAERVLVLSWGSFAVSIVPFCGSLWKLVDLQNLLSDLRRGAQRTFDGRTFSATEVQVGRRHHGVAVRLARLLMPVYGLGVLLTSLAANEVFRATSKQPSIACGNRVHPWLSTKEACLHRVINCAALGVAGAESDLAPMLALFDRSSLSEMIFVSCHGLEMPVGLREFKWLSLIAVVNSTVQTWGPSVELRDDFFVGLRTVFISNVEFVDDPVGLTGTDGPIVSTVEWIHLEYLDGDRVLALVGDHWRSVLDFDCVGCGLTAFPAVMHELPHLVFFSLALNDVATLPDGWPSVSGIQLQMLWLVGNPKLTELPDALWRQAATCGFFSLAHTNLSVVPEWVADVALHGFQITAVGSPVCTGQVTLSQRVQTLVVCDH